MKLVLSAFALIVVTSLTAEARPVVRYSEERACADIQAIVSAHGEALIYSHSEYAPVDLYDIAYANGCPEHVSVGSSFPFFVPTKDNDQCFVGYRCRQDQHGE